MLTLQRGHLLVMYTNRCDASSLFMQAECFVGLHQVSVELQSNRRRNAYCWHSEQSGVHAWTPLLATLPRYILKIHAL